MIGTFTGVFACPCNSFFVVGSFVTGVEAIDAGGVASTGVIKRSGFTARHVLAKVSWLRLARTFATRNSAVEPLPLSSPSLAFCASLRASPLTLIVGRVPAVKKAVWLVFGEKGGVGPLWAIASVAMSFDFQTVFVVSSNLKRSV